LIGCFAAMAADIFASPMVFIGIISIIGILDAFSYFVSAWRGKVGMTTEVTILISTLLGALCYWGNLSLAVALGIATTTILSLKVETDRLVRALTREDINAALRFAVISAIVLPVLPNQSFFDAPFDVLNPFKIWLMVVFISGISFLGYVAIKIVGPESGIGLTGFLGGMVSSTAVTLSFSQRSKRDLGLAKPFSLAITVAWTVMFARILITVGVLNQALLKGVWVPVLASCLAGLVYCSYLLFSQKSEEKGDLTFTNPFDLSSAIKFGLLYGAVLLISRAGQYYLGNTGLFLSSIVSGIADVDAITLSVTELTTTGGLSIDTASQAIVVAAMTNTFVKGCIALFWGSMALRKALLPGLILMLSVGLLVVFIA
jgi:uncharacterized membrane protein (DUF4010 family)